ncbi:DNA primase [bacterium]|nr:DNA primase [bacterium]
MSGSIPEHKIQDVREATDIVDLVSSYLNLKKKGANFFGLCPFHQEKTPSFSVNPAKQIFHCFGCGVGGNVFTYIMRHEGVSFPEAVKFLAKRAGIEIEYDEAEESVGKTNEALYYVNEFAASFFQENLLAPIGKSALAYLQDRGFSVEEINAFALGYAPQGWDGLLKRAEREGIDSELLARAGLTLKKGDRDHYDRFRNRVMFTIWNLSGRVVAFGGRKFTQEGDSPKYINSPETDVYEKGKLLYGLYQNRDAIRQTDQAVFVEGYTDLMSLGSKGVKNVAATLGTALTEDQARLIRRYTRNVVLMYDSDTAGTAATLRGADVLIANGMNVSIAVLPAGEDPDSLVLKEGAAGVQHYLESAPNLFEFKLKRLLEQAPERRSDSIRSLLQSLAKLSDSIHRSMLLRKVSETLAIDERILWDELQGVLRQQRRGQSRSQISERLNELTQLSKNTKTKVALQDLVRILIHQWDMAALIFENLELSALGESKLIPVLHYLKNRYKADRMPDESDLIDSLTDVEVTSFIVNTFAEDLKGLDFRRWALECISTIKKEEMQHKLDLVRNKIRQAQENGRPVKELLQDCVHLEEQKKRLDEQVALALK